MTITKKFHTIATNVEISNGHLIMKVPKIADDYAIEFAEWYYSANNNEYHLYPNASIEEHLQIFKKEKGL